ncbi:MAG: alanine--tRNA ligase [Candidatus Veblenbacteria bacterium RIFOXYC2_FULL_42_11]|uniref:alanine--tRNA ligase n=1 Tax=Candidatus Veblenbacteria bacterium RIFOXYC2_FULL_42_11 TaxID=1802428 RepID=A0A1G2Q8E9_9BACT|nr:MAG: alanine--tRNA ligase [Candidatus Veblenbacteria bacterium RIFOXYC2_FULL_42_11]
MTSLELRKKFLEFFATKGHKVIPSASLVPANDPTVLFTTAGMHPLVPYLLGEEHHAGKRLASAQKCIRTGDIEEVGDDTHLTCFEMLGNWSLGDYWKEDAIAWSFEFLTDKKWLGLPVEKLAISCFAGDKDAPQDNESAELWQKLGIPQERIAFLGKEDNWWGPAGLTGPCGPDTEMFYWTGGELAPKVFDPKDKRWFEIWNDVFMQYNKTEAGAYEPLKQKNVDTGMGLERTLAALNGNKSVYETELFVPIMDEVKKILQTIDVKSQRIISDHIKASVFLLSDGVKPSNKDRGYILRRLIRRAVFRGYKNDRNFDSKKVKSIAQVILEIYSDNYQEFEQEDKRAGILDDISLETRKFRATIEKGSKEADKGTSPFILFTSYGIPIELTQEIAEEKGGKIDLEKFNEDMKKHQELSRTSSAGQFKGGLADHSEIITRLHTVTHLMNAALRKVLGDHVWQKGSNITKERTRFDFTHSEKMTDEQKSKVEELVNSWIERDLTVKKEVMPLEQAKQLNAIGVFGEKYAETVSVYTVMDPKNGEVISREFCGGPHVEHTGVIGQFKILKEEAVAAGIRRIKAAVS